jgi:PAS domain S-box-containing protein
MGTLVLIGRIFDLKSLILFFPHAAPIQFNTALAIAFGGLALFSAQIENKKTAFLAAAIVGLIGVLTLLEYTLKVSIGIDQLVYPYLSSANAHPGRMAPNTALCFFIFGLAILFHVSQCFGRLTGLVSSTGGIFVGLLATVSLSSHVVDTHGALAWGSLSKMTLQASVALFLLGAGLIIVALKRDAEHQPLKRLDVSFLLVAASLVGTLFIWQVSVDDNARTIQKETQAQAQVVAQQITRGLDGRTRALERMADRWQFRGNTPYEEWKRDSANYFDDFPGFLSIGATDAHFLLRRLYPLEGHESLIGFNTHSGKERIEALDVALATHKTALTRIFELKLGGRGFGIYIPVFSHGRFNGMITAGFRTKVLLDQLVTAEGYEVYVWELGHPIYETRRSSPDYRREWGASTRFGYRNIEWSVEVVPSAITLQKQTTRLPHAILLCGFLMSLLMGLIARLFLLSRAGEQRAWLAVEWRRAILDSAQNIVIATDEKGVVQLFNRAAQKLLGYSSQEVIGKLTPVAFRDPKEVAEAEKVVGVKGIDALTFKTRSGSNEEQEVTFVRKDGSSFPVSLQISSIRGQDQRIAGFLGVATDITEKRKVLKALEQAKEAALEAARAKASFLANMSHEIRTPLNGIIGMTDLLLDTKLDSQQTKYARIVRDSSNGLLAVVNDVLDFSKIEAGKMKLEQIDFDLLSLIENQADLLTPRAREKGLSLMTYVAPEIAHSLVGDPGRLAQILINLIGNALKFTDQGTVVVSVDLLEKQGRNHSLRINVKDTGIGLSNAESASLFKPFIQADTTTARKYGGTGLGLSISKRLVQMMGGEIGVTSELGKGSTFWFTLCLPEGGEIQKKSYKDSGLGSLKVLIVDDDPPAGEIMSAYLSNWRMKAEIANSGEIGLSLLEQAAAANTPFDLIIIDKRMPSMDGFVLGGKVREIPQCRKTPMILATAYDRSGLIEEMKVAGFGALLTKPIKQSELYNAIVEAIHPHLSQPESALAIAPSDQLDSQKNSSAARILVVEDNSVNQLLVTTLLKKMGYLSQAVVNGIEAVEAIKKGSFDLVLMDCQMPEMDGYEATSLIRKWEETTGNHIPIVALTAHAMLEDEKKCLDAGMDAYLSKPIKRDRLVQVLKRWLSQKAA